MRDWKDKTNKPTEAKQSFKNSLLIAILCYLCGTKVPTRTDNLCTITKMVSHKQCILRSLSSLFSRGVGVSSEGDTTNACISLSAIYMTNHNQSLLEMMPGNFYCHFTDSYLVLSSWTCAIC